MAVERIGNNVRLDLSGLEKYRKNVRMSLRSTTPGPMLVVRKQWAQRYRSEMQLRYNRFARGGGDWPPLKSSTLKARRNKQGGQVSILIDLAQLVNALSPQFSNRDGQFEQAIPFGIDVGFGGPARKRIRPRKKSSKRRTSSKRRSVSSATVAEIAQFHQEGRGNNPVRKILVDPSLKLRGLMAGDMERGLQRMIDASQVRRN